ncbi:MAG: acetoin utilization protein AcuB [Rhodothermales bacterium]
MFDLSLGCTFSAMTTVQDIMTRLVVRVNADDPLGVVRHKLTQGGFHHLPVVDGNELIGIISDRDVLGALSPFLESLSERERDKRTLDKRAHQVMTPQPYTILPSATVEAAAEMILALDVSGLPVIDPDGHLVGIVTWHDLLYFFVDGPPKAS